MALAQSCSNASQGLQERAAGALWGLSVSEANRYIVLKKPFSYGNMLLYFLPSIFFCISIIRNMNVPKY